MLFAVINANKTKHVHHTIIQEEQKERVREALDAFLLAPSAGTYVDVKDAMQKYHQWVDDHSS